MGSIIPKWYVRYRKPGTKSAKRIVFATRAEACDYIQFHGVDAFPKRLAVDILIYDPVTKDWLFISRKVGIEDASIWAAQWLINEPLCPVVLWPSRLPLPANWRVIEADVAVEHLELKEGGAA